MTKDHRPSTTYIPLSALNGDNIVDKSKNTPWYRGKTLLNLLNTINHRPKTIDQRPSTNFRFPVQYVNRPNLNFRGFCGTIAGGSVEIGDDITILPSGKSTRVESIIDAGAITEANRDITVKRAYAPMAITITTEDEIDISRGDMIVHTKNMPSVSNNIKVMLVWMDEKPMVIDRVYDIKRATSVVTGSFEKINYRVDVNSYERVQVEELGLNDIASCRMVLTRPIAADAYSENRLAGSFIVIDRITNNTVGAGMIVGLSRRDNKSFNRKYSDAEIELNAFIIRNYPEWDCRKIC